MSLGLLGLKVGMTQVFTEAGVVEPVTVLQLGPCPVLQIRYPSTKEGNRDVRKDGYSAFQLGFKDKPRKNATRPEQGHAGTPVAVKDLLDTAGLATTYGSIIFASHPLKCSHHRASW